MENEQLAALNSLALRAEFDALMARSDIAVPIDRYEGALANYAEMRRLAGLLRRPRAAESEPSNVFSLSVVMRGQ